MDIQTEIDRLSVVMDSNDIFLSMTTEQLHDLLQEVLTVKKFTNIGDDNYNACLAMEYFIYTRRNELINGDYFKVS